MRRLMLIAALFWLAATPASAHAGHEEALHWNFEGWIRLTLVLIMWIPAGFVYLVAIMLLFVLWLRAAERRAEARLRRASAAVATIGLVLLALPGCGRSEDGSNAGVSATSFGGDPGRGAEQIVATGCGACHTIPGITGADALVGPPLDKMGRRIYLAGLLRNTPDNMIAWLRNPQRIVPGNVMPDMHLTQEQARDIAAYLYTLK